MSAKDVRAAAEIRAALGVPGAKPADVVLTENKLAMKAAVAAAGLRVPRHAPGPEVLSGAVGPRWSGRTILKPIDGAGSRGVASFPSVEEAIDALRADPGRDPATHEIEEFIDAPVVHLDGFLLAGEPIVLLASRYMGTCLEYAAGRPQGSVQLDDDRGLCRAALPCLRATGIVNGTFHLEMFEGPDGPVFLEVAARTGGGIVERIALTTGVESWWRPTSRPSLDRSPLADNRYRHLLEPRPTGRMGGDFLFPGHTLSSRFCRVEGGERFRADPRVHRWAERPADEPLASESSYLHFDLPLSGIVTGETTAEVEAFLANLLGSVRIVPA